jgi:hypothetical protein
MLLGTTLGLGSLTMLTGCGSKAAESAGDKAKAAAAAAAAKAKAAAGAVQQAASNPLQAVAGMAAGPKPTGTNFELKIETEKDPLKITSGKAEVAVIPNRPIGVNFVTTLTKDGSPFPNVLVSVRGEGKTLADLVGKEHPARIFIQVKQSQQMYTTQRDKPVMVTIEGGDDTYVSGKFEKAELFDSSGQETITLSGKLVGMIPQPPKPTEDKDKKAAEDKKKAGQK